MSQKKNDTEKTTQNGGNQKKQSAEKATKTPQKQDDQIQLVEAQQYRSAIERLIAFFKALIKRRKDTEILVFRRYKKLEGGKKKARHPKLIIEVTDDEYIFMGLTESEKKGRHKNIELIPNPKVPSFIIRLCSIIWQSPNFQFSW